MSDTGINFVAWPKLKRLTAAEFIATEKVDGTNACIQFRPQPDAVIPEAPGYEIAVQSRTRLITPTSDNHGFAAWAYENQESLFADLGYGVHFGEWWGAGIQRHYGQDDKHFSLFNTHRWADMADESYGKRFQTLRLHVVPVLARGNSLDDVSEQAFDRLRDYGSQIVPGWMTPEGYVITDIATGSRWKVTDAKAGPGKHDND